MIICVSYIIRSECSLTNRCHPDRLGLFNYSRYINPPLTVSARRPANAVSCESTLSPGGSVSKEREKRKPENIRAASVWSAPPPPCRIPSIAKCSERVSQDEVLARCWLLGATIKPVESWNTLATLTIRLRFAELYSIILNVETQTTSYRGDGAVMTT